VAEQDFSNYELCSSTGDAMAVGLGKTPTFLVACMVDAKLELWAVK
jgi:hypothetical protein